MATPNTLPISRLVNVTAILSPSAQQAESLSTFLILGNSPVIDPVTRIRSYDTIEEVGDDFGDSAPEYLAAELWFSQAPAPNQLYIGRWVESPSSGQLYGGALSAAQQAIANFTVVTNGGIDITIDATAKTLTGITFAAAGNLNAVAGILQTAIGGSATVVWNPFYNRFIVTSATTGTTSLVSFATTGAGTDISGLLGLTAATSGAYRAPGEAAESALACATLFDNMFGQQYFGFTMLAIADADAVLVAEYTQAASNYHYFGCTTQEAGVLSPSSTTDMAYLLSQVNGLSYTCVQYSSTSPYAVVSLLARILTTDYTQNNSTIDLFYKQEPGVEGEALTATQINALEAKNCNVFVNYNNATTIIEPGVSCAGIPFYIDTAIGIVSLVIAIQTAVYNLLYSNTTKVPQTDGGMHQIQTTIQAVCAQYVANGLLAPGTWTSGGFGSLDEGDFMPTGYYVYCPPIATQSVAARAARLSVPFQVAVKLAGAVNKVNVSILVNN